ncbi:MAG: hypothetical protein LBU81_06610 [Methanosarcinales archaeon]|jgi:hypothetical protein|nr:hypothetical protein [Methanosarcinales archaeon]
MKKPEFAIGEEYVLFLIQSDPKNPEYQLQPPEGYFIKNGLKYQGTLGGDEIIEISKSRLKYLISASQ